MTVCRACEWKTGYFGPRDHFVDAAQRQRGEEVWQGKKAEDSGAE
jgi:hypothetical protein